MGYLKLSFCKVNVFSVLFLIVLFSNIQYAFTRQLSILPNFIIYFDDLLCLVIFIHIVYVVIFKKKYQIDLTDMFMFLFIMSAFVSVLLNNVSIVTAVLGMRSFIMYYVLFVCFKLFNLSINDCKNILKLIKYLVLFHVPLTVLEYIKWNPSLPYSHEDSAFGYWFPGAANLLGILLGMFLFYLFIVDKSNKSLKSVLIVFTIISFVLTHSKIMYIFMLILAFYYSLFYFRESSKAIFVKYLFLIALLTVVVLFLAKFISNDVNNLLTFESIAILFKNQLDPISGGARIYYFLVTVDKLSSNVVTVLWGLGPGMYSSYEGISSKSKLLESVMLNDIEERSAGLDPDLTAMLGEYGLLGFILFSLMLLSICFTAYNYYKTTKCEFVKKYMMFFSGFSLLFYFGGFVNGLWQAPFISANFWAMAGIMYGMTRKSYENRY